MIATDKRALVVGVADNQSVARGVARARHRPGAMLAITYLNEKAEPHVRPPPTASTPPIIMPLDVTREEDGAALFARIGEVWSGLDILVHSIAFAPGGDVRGRSSTRAWAASRKPGTLPCIPSSASRGGRTANDRGRRLPRRELLRSRVGR
jgi:enoyl-[acyl-carrier-protein] reductase (NADH)